MKILENSASGCVVQVLGHVQLRFDFRAKTKERASEEEMMQSGGSSLVQHEIGGGADDVFEENDSSGVDIEPLFSGTSWGAIIWDASLALCEFLESMEEGLFTNKFVVELGACCGLPALVAALKGSKRTILSDLDAYLPAAQSSIDLNYGVLESRRSAAVDIKAVNLTWSRDNALSFVEKFGKADLVLAADCVSTDVYGRESWQALVQVMQILCSSQGQVILTSTRRPNDGFDEFLELVYAAFPVARKLTLQVSEALLPSLVTQASVFEVHQLSKG